MDLICEVQCNLPIADIDVALDQLTSEALAVLRQQCLESIERQSAIISRVQDRLAQSLE